MEKKRLVAALAVLGASFFVLVSGAYCEANLEVEGIIKDKKGSLAMINDEVVSEGDTVAGAKVVKIEDDGVLFNYKNQEFFKRVKGSAKTQQPAAPPQASVPKPIASEEVSPEESFMQGQNKLMQAQRASMQAVMSQMQSMPATGIGGVDPQLMQQALQAASAASAQATARQREIYQNIKEMEEGGAGLEE